MNKSISVCVTTYNGAKYIERQLNSIINQLPNSSDEILVSDDGSTDDTIKIVNKIKDSRIKILKANSGNLIKNFESVISQATGDYIFLADQDDIWNSNKIEQYLKSLKNYSLIYSNVSIIDENDLTIKNNLYPLGIDKSGFIKNIIKNSIIGATMAFRREVLEKSLPFPANITMHDQWIGTIAAMFFSVTYIKEPMLMYRRHSSNSSTTGSKSDRTRLTQLTSRLYLVKNLISRLFKIS